MTSFDFSNEEAWSSNSFLPVGVHLCTITEPKTGTSSGQHPQVEVRLTNKDGDSSRDWIVITPSTVGKLLQLTNSVGLPNPGTIDIPSDDWDAYVRQLDGKQVGVRVREERKGYGDNPEQMLAKPQAYLPPSEVLNANADVPADTSGLAQPVGASVQDDDIPF